MRKIFEAFFGESETVTKLDPSLYAKIGKECLEYIKDWPNEAFTIEFSYSPKLDSDGDPIQNSHASPDLDKFQMLHVKAFIAMMVEGLDISIRPTHVTDNDVQEIMKVLNHLQNKVEGDSQTVFYGDDDQMENIDYSYKIKSWKYDARKDTIDCDVVIDNLDIQ